MVPAGGINILRKHLAAETFTSYIHQQNINTPPLKRIEMALIIRTGEAFSRIYIVIVPTQIY